MRKALLIFSRSLRVNFRRYLLYSIGVALSVASVLSVGTLSEMAFSSIDKELDRVIFNGVEVSFSNLSAVNAAELVRSVASESNTLAMPFSSMTTVVDETVYTVSGVDQNARQFYSLKVSKGRFLTLENVESADRVCVIGKMLADKLSPDTSCVGNMLQLTVNGITEPFRIVGIYSSGYMDKLADVLGETIYIPNTVAEQIMGTSYVTSYQVGKDDSDRFLRLLNEKVTEKGYTSVDLTAQRKQLDGVFNTVTTVLSLITGVSIIVAAFNMLVITWIHIKNNYKEIGLKKSLGASRLDILLEYVVEAVGIAWIGTALGVVFNLLFCLVLNLTGNVIEYGGVRVVTVAAAVTVLSAVFGLIPSCMAARLQPIDTLRSS